jgi:hypothetical protein
MATDMKIAEVTLKVIYDPETMKHPSEWNWDEILTRNSTSIALVEVTSFRHPDFDYGCSWSA